jgi:hypothetical protein
MEMNLPVPLLNKQKSFFKNGEQEGKTSPV